PVMRAARPEVPEDEPSYVGVEIGLGKFLRGSLQVGRDSKDSPPRAFVGINALFETKDLFDIEKWLPIHIYASSETPETGLGAEAEVTMFGYRIRGGPSGISSDVGIDTPMKAGVTSGLKLELLPGQTLIR